MLLKLSTENDMADPVSPLLNYLSNLMTARASFRLLLVICSIILCWMKVEPYLLGMEIPTELVVTLVVLTGFSTGSLLSILVFNSIDYLLGKAKSLIKKRRLKKEKKDEREKEEIVLREKTEILARSLPEYSRKAEEILNKLLEKDCSLHIGTSKDVDIAINGLIDGDIIHVLSIIDETIYFCTINPLYRECIENFYEEKIMQQINDFLEKEENIDFLIELFSDNKNDITHTFEFPKNIVNSTYNYGPVILRKTFFGNKVRFKNVEIYNCDFKLYILPKYHKALSEKLNMKLRDFVFCHYQKSENELSATS